MTRIEKFSATWHGLLPVIAKLATEWQPPILKNELAYRDHLLAHVRQAVPADTTVEKEYRHRGTTVDLWLRWKGLLVTDELAIELKVNLKKKTEFDRLIGQVESLQPKNYKTLIVLIGATDEQLLARLREKYASYISPPIGTIATMAVVAVPTPKSAP